MGPVGYRRSLSPTGDYVGRTQIKGRLCAEADHLHADNTLAMVVVRGIERAMENKSTSYEVL